MADAVLARPPPSRCVCCSTAVKASPVSSSCASSELAPRNRSSVCSSSHASCEPLLTAGRRKLNGGRSRQYERDWDCRRISLLPRKLHCTSRGHRVLADAGGAQGDDEPWNPLSEDEAIRIQAQEELCRESTSGRGLGGLAYVEAFCRIYRGGEELHATVLDSIRNLNSDGLLVDVPDVEEAVVVGLARLAWLLDDGKEQLFGGKFIDLPSWKLGRSDGNGGKASFHPVAQFREEMLKCCDALQVGLTTLMALSEDRNAEGAVHRCLDRLRNVCVDAGAPRAEGAPSPGDIPNFALVDLVSSIGQNKPEPTLCRLWRGGRMTDTGLEWLLQRGFKLLIDLREGNERSLVLDPALNSAVDSGRVQVVRIPVAAGTAPSRDQVKEFAGLVGRMKDDEAVILSRRGVRRPCSMVARWKEFFLHEAQGSSLVGAHVDRVNGVLAIELPTGPQPVGEAIFSEVSNTSSGRDTSVAGEQIERIQVGGGNDVVRLLPVVGNGAFPTIVAERSPFKMVASPFEAQRPGPDAFTKQGMATFLKRKISPPLRPIKPSQGISSAGRSNMSQGLTNSENIAGAAGKWGPSSPGIPIAGPPVKDAVSIVTGSLSKRSENGFASPGGNADTSAGAEQQVTGSNPQVSDSLTGTNGNAASFPTASFNGALVGVGDNYQVLDDVDDPIPVEGDMCASTTGVVRVQSRRKAEMYLVRTDGFSCTRERVMESTLAFTHPSTQQQMLMWKTPPKTVLLLKKLGTELMEEAEQVAAFLHNEGMNVMVEPEAHDLFARSPGFGYVQTFYNQDVGELHERVDFVVCLGGDGVILHASNLFRNAVPPVVSFNLGSLGFLTAHPFENFRQALRAIIYGNSGMGVYITLRMRLRCELFREGRAIPGKVFEVMNEVVVDRGSNPYLSKIECYERNRLITKVQADGVLVATPTGSTAYSTAAGGSMVHPNVPCMLFTPICPHSLSFRPVILPDSALLELKVPSDARNNAWVSFDGKRRQQLRKGDSVRVGMSQHPVPTVNKSDQTNDWFSSLVRCLNWNERREQKELFPS